MSVQVDDGSRTVFDVTSENDDVELSIRSVANDGDAAEAATAKAKSVLNAFSGQYELKLSQEELDVMYHLMHKTGDSLYVVGAAAIYLWMSPRLVNLAMWIDPDCLSRVPENEQAIVMNPKDAYANVDLVGSLWSEKSSAKQTAAHATPKRHETRVDKNRKSKPKLYWKTLTSVINDPDQSNGPRTEALLRAGLEKATGIKFDVSGIRGMCVFYAKEGIDDKILADPATETYLYRATYMKGAMLAVVEARRRYIEILPDDTLGLDQTQTETTLESPSMMARELRNNMRGSVMRKHLVSWLKKTEGAGAQIPHSFSWSESIWTAAGTFLGLVLIAFINRTFKVLSDDEHFLVLGPFGALSMLQYGLVGSPAGQPRTVLLGHAIAGPIALGLTYIPEDRLAVGMRQILSVTLANFVMVKVGVACPPASAHSLIYAEGKHDWQFWGLALLGCLLSFIPAIFFNNLNPRRQYPSFWGYGPTRLYRRLTAKAEKDLKKAKQYQPTGTHADAATMEPERHKASTDDADPSKNFAA